MPDTPAHRGEPWESLDAIRRAVERLRRETAEAEGDCRRAGKVLLDTMAVSKALHEDGLRREQGE